MPVRLHGCFLSDWHRWVLWLPVGMGMGILLFFSLPSEPPPAAGPLFLLLATALAVRLRHAEAIIRFLAIGMLTIAIGFGSAQLRTEAVDTQMLAEHLPPVLLTGTVRKSERDHNAQKLMIDLASAESLYEPIVPGTLPDSVRVTVRHGDAPAFEPGDVIRVKAKLMPVPRPVLPGGYDFARHYYYLGIGASGYAMAMPEKLRKQEAVFGWRNWQAVAHYRLSEAIRAQVDQPYAGIATALMTGNREGIPDKIYEDLRSAGLAHLLAISGMHMALVCGIVFLIIRRSIVFLLPPHSLLDARKIAAGLTLIASFGYLFVTGFPVSAVRAYVMAALWLGSILLDRAVTPMRCLSFAAVLILLVMPESLMSPSFQMSFAATIGLVAFYEWLQLRKSARKDMPPPRHRISRYIEGIALSTLIAGTATTPFILYHFHSYASYGLLGNLLGVPLTGLFIMPSAIASYLLMPFGLEALGLWCLQQGIAGLVAISHWVASLPSSTIYLPPPTGSGLAVIALGVCWLCLWLQAWRHIGWLLILAGSLTGFFAATPDILADERGHYAAIREEEGWVLLSPRRSRNFTTKYWLSSYGQKQFLKADDRLHCNDDACIYHHAKAGRVGLIDNPKAIRHLCHELDVLITRFYVFEDCPEVTLMLDKPQLNRMGAHAVYLREGGGHHIETVVRKGICRRWHRCQKSGE